MRHAKREVLTTEDVNAALRLRNIEALYGFSANSDPLNFVRAVGTNDLYFIEDKVRSTHSDLGNYRIVSLYILLLMCFMACPRSLGSTSVPNRAHRNSTLARSSPQRFPPAHAISLYSFTGWQSRVCSQPSHRTHQPVRSILCCRPLPRTPFRARYRRMHIVVNS